MAANPRYREAAKLAKRGVPIALELYRRWQQLPPETRERYLRIARDYANRAGEAYQQRRRRNPPGGQR